MVAIEPGLLVIRISDGIVLKITEVNNTRRFCMLGHKKYGLIQSINELENNWLAFDPDLYSFDDLEAFANKSARKPRKPNLALKGPNNSFWEALLKAC